jgi:glycosyltransferase involved in cell wall biosynthesis
MEALESVFAQSYGNIEVIVVDDGSTDATPQILSEFGERVITLRQKNAGPARARNTGIQASSGDFISFLDADDVWMADKTEKQVSVLSENSEVGFCDGLMQNFWVAELADEAKEMEGTDIAAPQPGTTQTIMVRHTVFESVGLFNPALRHRDTMDWILRSKKAGIKSHRLDEIVYRRLHQNNRSSSRGKNDAEDLFAIIQS